MYALVTCKIWLYTRWWTNFSYFFYTFGSILVYIAYMWVSEVFPGQNMQYTILPLHMCPQFWMVVMFCAALGFLGDLAFEVFRMDHFKTGSDYVREFMKKKKGDGWNDLNIEI